MQRSDMFRTLELDGQNRTPILQMSLFYDRIAVMPLPLSFSSMVKKRNLPIRG